MSGSKQGILASFDYLDSAVDAIEALRKAGFKRKAIQAYAPVPEHDLEHAMGYQQSPVRVFALVGALTAVFAASIGFFQYDIKKVLAYSTVSQLGFMFIGVGVGAYWAGVFHLMTHAFFKACLFLGSGSVIHGMHAVEHDEVGAQDMRNMGGLKRVMPRTAKTYFISCLAITAAPIPFFAGFWSKDEILWKAFNSASMGWCRGAPSMPSA